MADGGLDEGEGGVAVVVARGARFFGTVAFDFVIVAVEVVVAGVFDTAVLRVARVQVQVGYLGPNAVWLEFWLEKSIEFWLQISLH